MDLLDFVRGELPWTKLLRILEFLPWSSAYKRALADDDEYAAEFRRQRLRREAEARRTGKKVPPPDSSISILDWDATREQTAHITDALQAVRLTIASQNLPKGKKAPRFKPSPRPTTAMDRAERRAEMAQHKSIVAQMLGNREE